MNLHSITEMAAKKICPNCGKSMAGYHFWYKGGWRCKGGGRSAEAGDAQNTVSGLRAAGDDGYDRHAVPPGFAEKIASLKFGEELTLKDGTHVRFMGAPEGGDPSVSLYGVRVASGPNAGRFLLLKPEDF